MASLSVAAGEIRAAEGYLLELLAWCAFADRDLASEIADDDPSMWPTLTPTRPPGRE